MRRASAYRATDGIWRTEGDRPRRRPRICLFSLLVDWLLDVNQRRHVSWIAIGSAASFFYWNKTDSIARPGPKPRATHGRGASRARRCSRINSMVADDILPKSRRMSRDTDVIAGDKPS